MDFKPTHMIDLLKCVRALSRPTWLAATRGGAQTNAACEVRETTAEGVVVRIAVESQEIVFSAPADALSEIPSVPTLARDDEPTRRMPGIGTPKPVEHAPLPVKTPRTETDEKAEPDKGPRRHGDGRPASPGGEAAPKAAPND